MYKKVLSPRISEVNGAGHIGHNVIPVWFEEGLIEILKLFDPDLKPKDSMLVMTNINIDYIQQIFLSAVVEIITGVKKIGNSSLVLDQKIYQSGQLCVKGKATYVNFSRESKKSTPIPPLIRQALKEHIIED
jgi:acyl-CoA thioester hydrolase